MASVVTGAFGYIGRYITQRLLALGETVATITTHPNKPNPFGNAVKAFPYDFDQPDRLTASLRGADTLYNTYWIRFEYGGATFRQAVENTATLFACARKAGVRKIVHVSVTNAAAAPALPYYAGKAAQERALAECGVPYCIVRPTLVFGREDILVNNIAWLIRKFPVFPIFGDGKYRVQPVFVEDLAKVATECARAERPVVVDVVGPETFEFLEMVEIVASKVRPGRRLVCVAPALGIALGKIIGWGVRDVVLTRDELRGLMAGLLTSEQAPNGATRFSEWIGAHRDEVGREYASELGRHFRWREGRRQGL